MKKGTAFIFKTFVLFISIILLASCSESQSTNKDKTYDKEFITALAEGLDSRWKITTDWSQSISIFRCFLFYIINTIGNTSLII